MCIENYRSYAGNNKRRVPKVGNPLIIKALKKKNPILI